MKLLIAALAITAVAARPAAAPLLPTATLDETTFAEGINKIVATYAFCGLPATDLNGVAQPFLAFAQSHRSTQYTKLLYEFQEESRITMALIQPTKSSFCAKAAGDRGRMIARARDDTAKLLKAEKESRAARGFE